MDSVTALLLASLTGANAPPSVQTDPTQLTVSNPTTATAITHAWPMLPGTPQAGTVYQLTTEFTGTWEANAMAPFVNVGGTWTQFAPSVGATSWTAGTIIAGKLALVIRVLSATQARFALDGVIGETSNSFTPGAGSIAMAQLSQTLTVAAASTIALGVLFGASNGAQGIATYGSTFLTLGGQG